MGFFKRRPRYEDPAEVKPDTHSVRPRDESVLTKKERRKLAALRKKAAQAARKAERESEKARQAAKKVREVTHPPTVGQETVAERDEDVPSDAAGADRGKLLSKREERKLKRLRRKAQKS